MYEPYIEAPYLAPVFTSKPIIIRLPCLEAKPCNKQSISNKQSVLFLRKAKAQAHTLAYGWFQIILYEKQVFINWLKSNNLKHFVISHGFTIKCFTYRTSSNKWLTSNKHYPLINTAILSAHIEITVSL